MTETAPKLTVAERMAKARAAKGKKPPSNPMAAPVAPTPVPRGPSPVAKAAAKMRARPNWDEAPDDTADGPDRLRIPREIVDKCRRDYGLDLQWVTSSVYGKPEPQRMAHFTKKHWTPLHNDDLDGLFDGMYHPRGSDATIEVDGLTLMARPLEISNRSRERERRDARLPVQIKEQQIHGGDLPGVSLDPRHKSVRNTIGKSMERIDIPDDQ